MKELRARHPMSNMQIIERFIDGVRYMKITPKTFLPLVLEKLKVMFAERPVKFDVSEDGWIKIEKLDKDEELEKTIKDNVNVDEEINEDYILDKEATMLKKQGFEVKITDSK